MGLIYTPTLSSITGFQGTPTDVLAWYNDDGQILTVEIRILGLSSSLLGGTHSLKVSLPENPESGAKSGSGDCNMSFINAVTSSDGVVTPTQTVASDNTFTMTFNTILSLNTGVVVRGRYSCAMSA